MSQNLKIFVWLMYGSLALAVAAGATSGFSLSEMFLLLLLVGLVAGLVRAARRGSRLSASVLGALTALSVLVVIADLSGGAWLAPLVSDPPPSTVTLVIETVGTLLMAAAMAVYLFGDSRTPQQ